MNENATTTVCFEDCALHCLRRRGACVAFYYTTVTLETDPRNCQLYHEYFVYVEPTTTAAPDNVTTVAPTTGSADVASGGVLGPK